MGSYTFFHTEKPFFFFKLNLYSLTYYWEHYALVFTSFYYIPNKSRFSNRIKNFVTGTGTGTGSTGTGTGIGSTGIGYFKFFLNCWLNIYAFWGVFYVIFSRVSGYNAGYQLCPPPALRKAQKKVVELTLTLLNTNSLNSSTLIEEVEEVDLSLFYTWHPSYVICMTSFFFPVCILNVLFAINIDKWRSKKKQS